VNYGLVVRQIGLLVLVLSAVILAVALFSAADWWSGYAEEREACRALTLSAVIGALLGAAAWRWVGSRGELGRREALLLVACSWFIGAALSAAPYRLWAALAPPDAGAGRADFSNGFNCYFEAMSGLTTTGATTLTAIATVPRSLLLWRATTHWLGGLGIIVLFVAVLPALGVGGRRLFRVESPGPAPEGVRPRIQDAARALWLIYSGLTLLEIVILWLCGMPLFESVCHTFATLATGGFSTVDASIAAWPSHAVHVVIIVFMLLAGVNFGLYHHVMLGRWRRALHDAELHAYVGIMVAATIVVTVVCLVVRPASMIGLPWGVVVRDAAFQVVSIQTTTGFCTADFDSWGPTAKAILVALMFVGGSAGSTGGGMKVIRVIIVAKVAAADLEQAFRPNVVRTVRVGGQAVDGEMKLATLVYVLAILACCALGGLGLLVIEHDNGIDPTTAFTAAAATLNNIGPGLGLAGATKNYAWFSDSSKVVMCILMAVGRLELFTIAVLFLPAFWKAPS